ncbi:MAG TPA: carbamoyl-phosphate synthase subunit L, partial [Rubrivivax sp.]|nr:carbamoyl-phosphate synthase subunit L [Rubrivivax sp.]
GGFGAWSAADVTGWQMHAGNDPLTAVPALLLRDGARLRPVRFGQVDGDGALTVQVDDERVRLALHEFEPGAGDARWRLAVGGSVETLGIARQGDVLFVQARGRAHMLDAVAYLTQAGAAKGTSGELRTPMMGTILATHAEVGQALRAGDVVVTMESMKMEMKICAEHDGVLESLTAAAGQTVERGRVVAVVAAAQGAA